MFTLAFFSPPQNLKAKASLVPLGKRNASWSESVAPNVTCEHEEFIFTGTLCPFTYIQNLT